MCSSRASAIAACGGVLLVAWTVLWHGGDRIHFLKNRNERFQQSRSVRRERLSATVRARNARARFAANITHARVTKENYKYTLTYTHVHIIVLYIHIQISMYVYRRRAGGTNKSRARVCWSNIITQLHYTIQHDRLLWASTHIYILWSRNAQFIVYAFVCAVRVRDHHDQHSLYARVLTKTIPQIPLKNSLLHSSHQQPHAACKLKNLCVPINETVFTGVLGGIF